MPPLRNGIADYARALLDFHVRDYDCIVVVDDWAPEPEGLPPEVLVMRNVEYRQHARSLGRHRHLFHVGNNGDHVYMLDHLLNVRGTVVVHDPSVRHMLREATVGGKAWRERQKRAVWKSHGQAGVVLADQAAQFRWETTVNYLELNGLGEVLASACGAIAHSWYGLLKIEQARPGLPSRRIEHFAQRPSSDRSSRRAAARRALGVNPEDLVLLSLGFVTEAKQIRQVIATLAEIQSRLPRAQYIVVGQEHEISVMAVAKDYGVQHLLRHVGYAPEADILKYLDAADILINLRYPTMGETSGALCRALARGVCAIVSDHGSYGELPDEIVVKTAPSENVKRELASALLAYANLPKLRLAVERAAYAWAEENADISSIATAYHEAIETFHASPARAGPVPSARCEADLTAGLIRKRIAMMPKRGLTPSDPAFVGCLWWSEGLVPLPDADGELLVGGPPTLPSAVAGCLRTPTTSVGPSSVGLFVGRWSEVSRSGTALSEFVARLTSHGVAFFDIVQDDSKGPPLTVDRLCETLMLHDLEVVTIADGSSKPLFALGLNENTFLEVGVLARLHRRVDEG